MVEGLRKTSAWKGFPPICDHGSENPPPMVFPKRSTVEPNAVLVLPEIGLKNPTGRLPEAYGGTAGCL